MTSFTEIETEKSHNIELWESTIPGRIWFETTDHLGRSKSVSTHGQGSRLKISTLDREAIEFQIRNENDNMFRNGMMIRIDQPAESPEALTDDQLREFFALDDAEFADLIEGFGEVNLRRMKALAKEANANINQVEAVTNLIEQRYSVGGAMPSYEDVKDKF